MAKQYGIHQIRGKVGQMAYYRQSGVKDSLIRGINQGLSARVKTGQEYANTRRNNAEFGAACGVAGVCGEVVIPKFRPMFLVFSQAKLAKKALELIKQDTSAGATWGTRSLTAERWPLMLEFLNDLSKNAFDSYISDVEQEISTGTAGRMIDTINVTLSPNFNAKMEEIGASSVNIYVAICSSSAGKYSTDSQSYVPAESIILGLGSETLVNESEDFQVTYSPRNILNGIDTCTLVVVPVKEVNGASYELQEFAAFKAFELATE